MPSQFDVYNEGQDDLDNPASSAEAITPHATDPLAAPTRGIFVGGDGDLVCRLLNDDDDTTFTGVKGGQVYPFRATHVRATSTATSLVALY